MGKTITTIIVALLIILGIYYVVANRVNTNNTNGAYSSTTSSTEQGEYGSTTQMGAGSGSGSLTGVATTSKNVSMDIKNFAFALTPLTVPVGTKVTWTNRDTAPHTVTSATTSSNSAMELDSPKLSKGQSYSHTFTKAGTYEYYCTVHPNMKATIIVQ